MFYQNMFYSWNVCVKKVDKIFSFPRVVRSVSHIKCESCL